MVTRFSKHEVIPGVIKRSSLRVTAVDDLHGGFGMCRGLEYESTDSGGECEVSEAKCSALGESGGCLIASGVSREHLGTAGGHEGCARNPGGMASLGQ